MLEGASNPEIPESVTSIERELDSYLTSALTVYDVTKAIPHPYNAVASMASGWAHDFIGFAQSLIARLTLLTAQCDLAQATLDGMPHADSCPSFHDEDAEKPCRCWKADYARAAGDLRVSLGRRFTR
jgi:hypothetical protein